MEQLTTATLVSVREQSAVFTVMVKCSQAPALKSAQIDQVHVCLPCAANAVHPASGNPSWKQRQA